MPQGVFRLSGALVLDNTALISYSENVKEISAASNNNLK